VTQKALENSIEDCFKNFSKAKDFKHHLPIQFHSLKGDLLAAIKFAINESTKSLLKDGPMPMNGNEARERFELIV
jgi:hypothetical protein